MTQAQKPEAQKGDSSWLFPIPPLFFSSISPLVILWPEAPGWLAQQETDRCRVEKFFGDWDSHNLAFSGWGWAGNSLHTMIEKQNTQGHTVPPSHSGCAGVFKCVCFTVSTALLSYSARTLGRCHLLLSPSVTCYSPPTPSPWSEAPILTLVLCAELRPIQWVLFWFTWYLSLQSASFQAPLVIRYFSTCLNQYGIDRSVIHSPSPATSELQVLPGQDSVCIQYDNAFI